MKQPTARKLDIVLRSAAGLKKVSTSRMAAYAVVWIEPSLRVPSPMDKRHGRNPVWDTIISITLDERTLGRAGKCLHIELLGQGLVSTKPIGFVRIDMTEILLKGSQGAAVHAPFHDHPVTRRSGRQQGILNFELCLQASTNTEVEHSRDATPASFLPSAPAQPQFHHRESTLDAQRHGTGSYASHKNVSRLREISEDIGYGVVVSNATARGSMSRQEEFSLLDSNNYY